MGCRQHQTLRSRTRRRLYPHVITPAQIFGGLLLGLVMGGCQSANVTPTPATTHSKKVVFTTFTVLSDMAKNIAGDLTDVESITKLGAEIHGYEPTPSDFVRGQEADLILENGLNLERWAERFYNNLPDVPHEVLTYGIRPIAIRDDAYKGKPNPHAWMSPRNALIYVDNIRKALVQLDAANASRYNVNAGAYSLKIQALDRKLKQAIAVVPQDQRYIVTCEGAFSYLAYDYGLKEIYLWPVNSERQATPQQVERVIKTVKAKRVPAVFCESTVNHQAQRQVAKESGAKFAGVFYVDSLSPPDGPASTYLQLLEHNVSTLINGLQAKGSTPQRTNE
jgi:manganese transport system substrate-binding protein